MSLSPEIIVVDADALIALVDTEDPLSSRALSLVGRLQEREVSLLYPATTITEAATTLQRKLNKPNLVAQIVAGAKAHQFLIEPVDDMTIEEAVDLFNPHGSKKNTLFDAIVAAVAKKHHARAVFSFDEWYTKVGFELVSNVV